jgi:hypothetical protein
MLHRMRIPTGTPLLGPDFPLPLEHPFHASTASAAGISRKVLGRLLREGYTRRMLKGVYVAAQTPDSLALRTEALALVVPAEAVVTDWTATWLYTGLLPPGDHLVVPPVSMFLPAGRGRLRNGLVHSGERAFVRSDLDVVGGFTVTTPVRTAWDIGRFSRRDPAMGGLDGLMRYGAPRDDMLMGVERFRRQRGVVQLRELAPLADPRAESPAESVVRLRWLDLHSLPRPVPQVPILDDDGRAIYWLDLGVPELRFAVEYDGELFHSTDADRAHDAQRREWIRRERGWIIVPVRRHNVFGPTRDIEEILVAGIDRARRELGRFRPAA